MTQTQSNKVGQLVNWLEGMAKFRKVAVALSPKFVITVARQHKLDRRDNHSTYVVTLGKPNFSMRVRIKRAKATDFPLYVDIRETR